MHIRCSAHLRRAVICRKLQAPLVDLHRLAETALHHPDIGKSDGSPDGIGNVPGHAEPGQAIGKGSVGRIEISPRPRGEAEQPCGRPTPEVVVLADEAEGLPGIQGARGEIAQRQRMCGAVHCYRTREPASRRLVTHDGGGGPGLWSLRIICRRVKPALGVPQPVVNPAEVAAGQQRSGVADAKGGPGADHLVGEGLIPAQRSGLLPLLVQRWRGQLDQIRRPRVVPGGERVADRLGACAVALVPRARAPVQRRHLRRLLGQQLRCEDVGEEVMVAIPLAPVVQRHDKEVATIERLQPRAAVLLAGHGITQRAVEAVENGGLKEETAHGFGLALKHLFDQIVKNVAVVARESTDEGGDILMALEGEGGQLQTGDPAFGALFQGADIVGRETQAHHYGEKCCGLSAGEAQVGGPKLGQLAAGA